MPYSVGAQLRWIRKLLKGHYGWLWGYMGLEILSLLLGLSFVYWSKRAVDIATGNTTGRLAASHLLYDCFHCFGDIERAVGCVAQREDKDKDDGSSAEFAGVFADAHNVGKHEALAYGRLVGTDDHRHAGSGANGNHHFS